MKQYSIQMEITRIATVVVEAASESDARARANDLTYKHELVGEIIRWRVIGVAGAGDADTTDVEDPASG